MGQLGCCDIIGLTLLVFLLFTITFIILVTFPYSAHTVPKDMNMCLTKMAKLKKENLLILGTECGIVSLLGGFL